MIHQFTEADKQAPWFKRLQDSLEDRLQALREKNDRDNDPEQTAKTRGQIGEIKNLLHDMRGTNTAAPQPSRRNPYD